MSDVALVPQKSEIWWIFLLQGFAGIIIGLMLITEPGATMVALTTVLGFYWLITGVLALVQVFVDRATPWFGRCSPASSASWLGSLFCDTRSSQP